MMTKPLVDVRHLNVRFVTPEATIHAVNGVDFSLAEGEVLAVLGESGCGKSVTLRSLIRLLPPRRTQVEGSIRIAGHDVLALSPRELAGMRGRTVSMIFQEPMVAFDPVFTVGQQIVETIVRHEQTSRQTAHARARDLFDLVQIPSPQRRLRAYPHELSGGMRQRAMIALALACRPRLLLADEPTTALDATVQIQILLLLRQLQQELGMAMIFVTHDIGVAVEVADRLAVMYAGRFVETGLVREVFRTPLHPYTAGLLASTVSRSKRGELLETIPGSPPDLAMLPSGCSFAPRCRHVSDPCLAQSPADVAIGPTHSARCLLLEPSPSTPPT
ncbi:MAG: ABC transporter [Candidatus Entotheonella factor]|uniref:ABC transporter n=1 Tax=Entotheonella factor TaxID=1429438 RepID=W4LPQ0_ENTF1|nr:MAG: ABC transporter [Candidatus Entotheonella factor]